jgi:hypothetical protein
MAIFIQHAECGCPECVVNPCDEYCPCSFFATDTGTHADLTFTDSWSVTSDFLIAHNLQIDVSCGGSCRFIVRANGSIVYDSGCITDTSDTDTVSIPAGTTTLAIEILACSESSEWDFDLQCV